MHGYIGASEELAAYSSKYETVVKDLRHAAIIAALDCHDTKKPITAAHIFKVTVPDYYVRSTSCIAGRTSYRVGFYHIGRFWDYNDLRSYLDQTAWDLLHAKPDYLHRLCQREA